MAISSWAWGAVLVLGYIQKYEVRLFVAMPTDGSAGQAKRVTGIEPA